MKNLSIIILTITILILFGIIIKNKDLNAQKEINKFLLENNEANSNFIVTNDMLHTCLTYSLQYQDMKIDGDLVLTTEEGNERRLASVINKKKFVIYINEMGCDLCIRTAMYQIEKMAEDIGAENILLLGNYNSYIGLYKFKILNKIKYKTFKIDQPPFSKNIPNIPFCFIIDKDLSISNFTLMFKEMPEITEENIKIIQNKFNAN